MIILHISDFHARERWYDWLLRQAQTKQWDAIVISGDFLDMFAPLSVARGQIAMVTAKLNALPAGLPLLLCSGNHDRPFGPEGLVPIWLRQLARKRPNTFIDGDRVTLQGVQFEMVGWGGIPTGAADYYVIHSPPEGARTARSEHGDWGSFELGCHLAVHAGVALCGHVHIPERWHDLRTGLKSLNPAVGDGLSPHLGGPQDDRTEPAYVVIDTSRRMAMRGSEHLPL